MDGVPRHRHCLWRPETYGWKVKETFRVDVVTKLLQIKYVNKQIQGLQNKGLRIVPSINSILHYSLRLIPQSQ